MAFEKQMPLTGPTRTVWFRQWSVFSFPDLFVCLPSRYFYLVEDSIPENRIFHFTTLFLLFPYILYTKSELVTGPNNPLVPCGWLFLFPALLVAGVWCWIVRFVYSRRWLSVSMSKSGCQLSDLFLGFFFPPRVFLGSWPQLTHNFAGTCCNSVGTKYDQSLADELFDEQDEKKENLTRRALWFTISKNFQDVN